MDLLDITQCKKDLDFKPCRKTTDSLPSIAWNKYLITGFDRTAGTVINLTAPLPSLMRDCYPNLTLPETARFLDRLRFLRNDYWVFDLDEILQCYSLINHPELHEIFGLILLLPLDLQNWISERGLVPKELYPLRNLLKSQPDAKTGFMFDIFSDLKARKASRSQCARVIELGTDLFLMGQDIWPKSGVSIESWVRNLEKKRYPQSTADALGLQNISWPSKVQARWVTDGDSKGIEVKFSVQNATEFENFVKGLESISPQLRDKVWKNH